MKSLEASSCISCGVASWSARSLARGGVLRRSLQKAASSLRVAVVEESSEWRHERRLSVSLRRNGWAWEGDQCRVTEEAITAGRCQSRRQFYLLLTSRGG